MMNRKFFALVTTLIIIAASALAQGPNNSGNYYQNADGKKGESLKTALYSIIKNHTTLSYSSLEDYYKKTDMRPDGHVRDWYSNITNYDWNQHGNKSEGSGWNKEHTVPQSWFNEASPMKSDIIHVVPTDAKINNMRSAYVIAEVGNISKASANNYSILGSCKTPGYSGTVFEPNDEIKGDIARIYFYMATCYQDKLNNWSKGEAKKVFTNDAYPGLQQWYLDMLFRWSKQDPIDEVELARNNAVAGNDVQGNRNPFVDYPGLEEYVWGSKKEQAFSYDNYEGTGTDVDYVAQPVFTPEGGSYKDQVVVSMSCATEGAVIYYTTNNTNATTGSKVYTEPITLTETTTLKAIAVKDGTSSFQTTATYTITNDGGDPKPVEGMIAFGNDLFNTNFDGSISGNNLGTFSGTEGDITVVYAKGDGTNQFINNEQIRLYQKNTLTISTSDGSLVELEFQLAKDTSKKLQASTGSVTDLTWTGNATSVVFNVNDGSGNMQLSGVKVTLHSSETGIHSTAIGKQDEDAFYTLSGQHIEKRPMKAGIYICNGKKVLIR
ncbi:endonuclease [Prevotella sp. E9-3]|uniref:endonuclease n=1 Tax=Prevotella sp. E9-3 TaxID=2913621 RepID=UPI001EDB991F|nr:endonuclease [Prevotella sp. E9-3]UKK48516.1 endonuclease [Prevotella sp. E9-3]